MIEERSFEQEAPTSTSSQESNRMSRRQVLRSMATTGLAVGGFSVAGGALLSACGDTKQGTTVQAVTLTLGDWPVAPIPSQLKKGETDPFKRAVAEMVGEWNKKHPNVTLKYSSVDVSDAQKLTAAISGRREPAIHADFGGQAQDRSAAAQKLMAETTDLLTKFNVDSLLADYAKPYWKDWNWGGHYYGLPGDVVLPGNGIMLRRDILKEAGIKEPDINYTWDDFRSILKQLKTYNKGKPAMAAVPYQSGYLFGSNLLEDIAKVPSPATGYHYRLDYSPWKDEWKSVTQFWRDINFTDQTVLMSPSTYAWEGACMGPFCAGQFYMTPAFGLFYTTGGWAPVTVGDMPAKFNKPIDELVTFLPYPKGQNGAWSSVNNASFGIACLSTHLKGEALNAAADLYLYMFYGEGYTKGRKLRYDYSDPKKPQLIYDYAAPGNKFQDNPETPNITVRDAWGKSYVDTVMQIINTPKAPDSGSFFSVDKSAGPTDAPHQNFLGKLSTTKDPIDPIIDQYQNTYNSEAKTLSSDLSSATFKTQAQAYYSAANSFWQSASPKFFSGDWSKYYQEVQQALG